MLSIGLLIRNGMLIISLLFLFFYIFCFYYLFIHLFILLFFLIFYSIVLHLASASALHIRTLQGPLKMFS